MVEAFSLRTAHHFGDALASQARLRYRVFVEQRRLEHPNFEGMEYDEFDTPGAQYFTWRDRDDVARGLIRLLPTTLPYMMKTYWPHLMVDEDLPCCRSVWEVTRLCVDRDYRGSDRGRIMPEIMCAVQEYCAQRGIETIVGVTRRHLIEHFLRQGVRWLGPTEHIEGEPEAAFKVGLAHMRPEYHCRKYSLSGSLLRTAPGDLERRAA